MNTTDLFEYNGARALGVERDDHEDEEQGDDHIPEQYRRRQPRQPVKCEAKDVKQCNGKVPTEQEFPTLARAKLKAAPRGWEIVEEDGSKEEWVKVDPLGDKPKSWAEKLRQKGEK